MENNNKAVETATDNRINKRMIQILWTALSLVAGFSFWTVIGKIDDVGSKVDKIIAPEGYLAKVNEKIIRLEEKVNYPIPDEIEDRIVDRVYTKSISEIKNYYILEVRDSENRLYRFFGDKVEDKINIGYKKCEMRSDQADKERKEIWEFIRRECKEDNINK